MNKLDLKHRGGYKSTGLLKRIILWAMILSFVLSGNCMGFSTTKSVDTHHLKDYHGTPFILLNDNIPEFQEGDLVTEAYQKFSPLDSLGRTGPGIACLGNETIPSGKRGSIGDVRPSGWHTVRYDDLIEDRYLYNRCHVIGYQLGGDNATPENLFTGTRYLNMNSMLFFENMVASFLRDNKSSHVMYRVTPVYDGSDLVASGVKMEAYSVEDHGNGVSFNVYLYNIQPGVVIDYSTGESKRDSTSTSIDIMTCSAAYDMLTSPDQRILKLDLEEDASDYAARSRSIISEPKRDQPSKAAYVLNTNTKKFHRPECSSVYDIKDKNRKEFFGTREEAISAGYVPCKRCKP